MQQWNPKSLLFQPHVVVFNPRKGTSIQIIIFAFVAQYKVKHISHKELIDYENRKLNKNLINPSREKVVIKISCFYI